MDISPLAKLMTLVFSLLGLAMHVRFLPFWDPFNRLSFAESWSMASAAEKILILHRITTPFAYYVYCLGSCFTKVKSRGQNLIAVIVFVLAVPVFSEMDARLPTLTRNAIFTGMWWIGQYFGKPAASNS